MFKSWVFLHNETLKSVLPQLDTGYSIENYFALVSNHLGLKLCNFVVVLIISAISPKYTSTPISS